MQGINAEIERQTALLEAGEEISQETLHFDPASGRLTPLRSKEEAHDYRYFPEPDLVPLAPTEEMVQAARDALPELPAERAERYERDWGLPEETARLFAFRPELGDYFEAAATAADDSPAVATWVKDELLARLPAESDPTASNVPPTALAQLTGLVQDGAVTRGAARKVLDRMVEHGGDAAEIVEQEGLGAMGDGDELAAIVARVIEANPDVAERVRGGNPKAIGALVGPVMRETKGRADGGEVNRLLREQLGV
jgi:aspartyl-tRNA(Asn)/glutamyl-tRNA(Gln) amidotransferase subunit B